jgi:hypothetical protein
VFAGFYVAWVTNLLRDEHTCCLVADFLAKGIFEGGDGISRLKDELLVRQA